MRKFKKIFLLTTTFFFLQETLAHAGFLSIPVVVVWDIGIAAGAFGTTVGGILLAVATVASIGYSLYSSLSADRLKVGDFSKYTSSELNNSFSNEGIVPIIYGGPIVVGGNIVWQSDPGTTVQRFLGLCIGEISAVTNVEVDDQDIAGLSGCSYDAYLGTSGQTVDARAGGIVYGMKDFAYLALTLTAGEKVSGNPTITCRVTGRKIKTWDQATLSWDTNAVSASNNPAAVIRDYLLLSSVLGGAGLSESFLDDASFGSVSEYCNVRINDGSGGTEKRFTLDISIDTKHSVLDNLAKMMITFNGGIIRSGATYKLICEKSDLTAQVAFTEDNIIRDSFTFGYGVEGDIPNQVGIEWVSPLEKKNPKRVEFFDDEIEQEIRGKRSETIPAYGIIRQSQASRLARKAYYERKVNDIWCQFSANIEGLGLEPGDVVSVTHSRPEWTAALFRIVGIKEVDYGVAQYDCVAYNSSILEDQHSTTYFTTWDYGSPLNPFEPCADVTGVVLEEIGWRNNDGVHIAHIDVFWTPPTTTMEILDYYIIEIQKANEGYILSGIENRESTSHRINLNLEIGESYTIKVKTRNREGIISDGTASAALVLIGKDAAPSDVTSFIVKKNRDKVVCMWTQVTDVDVRRYEIRKGDDWDSGQILESNIFGNAATLNDIKTGSGQSYWIKAIDNSGNYSATAKEAVVTIDNIPFQNIVVSYSEEDAWDGAMVDVEVSGDNLILSAGELTGTYTTTVKDIGYICEARIIIDFVAAIAQSTAWDSDPLAAFDDSTTLRFTGEQAPGACTFQIKTSNDNNTWTDWEDWMVADYKCEFFQIRMTVTRESLATDILVSTLTISADLPDVDEVQDYEITVAASGIEIAFDKTYHEVPAVNVDILSGDGIVHTFFTGAVYDKIETDGCAIKHLALNGDEKTGTGKIHVHGI